MTADSSSRPVRPTASSFLASLIVFFSATQLGIHFWPSSTLVYGIRIDYLSPTLYFLDLLILTYLFSLKSKILNLKSLFPFFPLLLTNLLFSTTPLSTLSWSLHLLLYSIFLISLSPSSLPQLLTRILPLTLLFQVVLATTQFILGHSVGGPLYYLGERMVAVGSPAVALGSFMGQVVLRAYGTFSHPNVLAGYAVVALLIVFELRRQHQSSVGAKAVWIMVLLSSLLVFLTQSRSAALAMFGLVIPFYLINKIQLRLTYFVILGFLVIGHWSLVIPIRPDLSMTERLDLQGLSLQVIRSFPVFGTGAQASISTYPTVAPNFRLLQPDHNSLTLFFSWFGLFGTLAILSVITRLVPLRGIIAGLPLFALDHYLLTSPQGLFIFLLYLTVALNYSHAS